MTDPIQDAERLGFDVVYDEHFPFVYRRVRQLGVADALIDDVVQEIFVVIHRQLNGFEGRSSMRAWVAGITRRVVQDQLRRKRNQPAGSALAAEPADERPTPEHVLDRRRALETISRLLEQLSPEHREAFYLHEMEGLSGREISEVLDIPENTAWSRIKGARRKFNTLLAKRERANG
ncbi:MAG: RNA polymerase sigma factor [Myxococcota bacterium]